jgi:hypothetical protein
LAQETDIFLHTDPVGEHGEGFLTGTLKERELLEVGGLLFLEPEDIKNVSMGAIWNFGKRTRLSWADVKIMEHKGPVCKAWVHRDRNGSNPM